MTLPFTRLAFLDVFGAYNTLMWPALAVLWLLSVALLVRALAGRETSRAAAILLAAHWAWSGVVYHFGFFAEINPAAWLFGTLFVLEAVMIIRHWRLGGLQPAGSSRHGRWLALCWPGTRSSIR